MDFFEFDWIFQQFTPSFHFPLFDQHQGIFHGLSLHIYLFGGLQIAVLTYGEGHALVLYVVYGLLHTQRTLLLASFFSLQLFKGFVYLATK